MMTDRQRFNATMHYRPRDRAPICDFGFWPETIVAWHEQGLPRWVRPDDPNTTDRFFGMDTCLSGGPAFHVGLAPPFDTEVLEDCGDHELVRQHDGVTVLRKKFMGSIPQHHAHLLVDRESWNTHYKPRLDPSHSARYPSDWTAASAIWNDETRQECAVAPCGSLYGWLRDWMGVEAISYVVHDDPAWFEQMVTTLADCTIAVLQRAFEHGARFDSAHFWEDMCYSGGPLLSPTDFKRFLVPQYRRITELLRANGVDVVWVDCDGKIDALIPLWLDAGVNSMFPIEVGTWGADPVALRRQFGKELLLMGGFDKRILMRSTADIEREVIRLAPLVEQGGYIGFCDHRVPPDVSLSNYLFYLECVRHVWTNA